MSTDISFQLIGKPSKGPVDWGKITIQASFLHESDDGRSINSVQPNITTDEFTFVLDDFISINNWLEEGRTSQLHGVFEGPCFDIVANDKRIGEEFQAFKGYLDLAQLLRIDFPGKLTTKVKETDGLNSFGERARGTIYPLLIDEGLITDADFIDLEYVVEKKIQFLEIALTTLAIYLMIKELAEAIKDLAYTIQEVISLATAGVGGPVSAVALAIGKALIQLAYVAILIIAIINMVRDLINKLISPIRRHKTIRLRTLLEKGAEFLGYTLDCPLPEIEYVYLPSKPDEEEPIQLGIPRVSDFGFTIDEAFGLVQMLTNSKIAIINGVVHLRTLSDPFWDETSTYKMPGLNLESKELNTAEFRANKSWAFTIDESDLWTSNNYKGTSFAVNVSQIKNDNDDKVLMTGFEAVKFPVSLPNRKDGLNELETALLGLAGAADAILKFFGTPSNLSSRITRRVGPLKVSHNIHSVAKIVPITGTNKIKVAANHRDILSASELYTRYHNERSFVANNFGQQHEIHTGVTVPFGLEDFLQVINNSFFQTWDNRDGKIDSFSWVIGEDKAEMDFRIRDIYDINLKETFFEEE